MQTNLKRITNRHIAQCLAEVERMGLSDVSNTKKTVKKHFRFLEKDIELLLSTQANEVGSEKANTILSLIRN